MTRSKSDPLVGGMRRSNNVNKVRLECPFTVTKDA